MVAVSVTLLIHISIGIGTILYSLNPINASLLSSNYYKIRIYITQSTAVMYRWYVVAASFDRCTLSSRNLRLKYFAQINITRRTLVGIVIIWIVLPVHNLIYNTSNLNFVDFTYNIPLLFYHSFFTFTTGCTVPVSITIVCSLVIYHNLVVKRERRHVITNLHRGFNTNVMEQEERRDRQVLLVLIVQIIAFIITIIPFIASYFYNAATLTIKNQSIERVSIEKFVAYLASLTIYLFPAISFYLYTMTFNIFRNELKKINTTHTTMSLSTS
ncbi:unnamed protein product [Rotaria magnacalcarata]|uniref:G-protein coupled receptors family 1 profile domain-containing protein n=1 Tax=Rotaria magnacalcarata TaxID=392030 RepID=A0A819A4E7_9BILA|nr:unnamed protein product [Rotaria magnacalcarata]CAF3779570.1 unnamed protein product [Rotaria magnacalcarata]